jgi:hypothetical protein
MSLRNPVFMQSIIGQMRSNKAVGWFLLAWLCVAQAMACGPAPQKVVEQIEIQATLPAVQALLAQPEAIAKWHPLVQQVSVTPALNEAATPVMHRTLQLRQGWRLEEELRTPFKPSVVEDSLMAGGSFPMSQYRGVLEVRPTKDPAKVLIVWSARFNNQANLLDAPAGQDNATAIAAVTDFYRQGLQGLKQFLQASATHSSNQ